MKHHPVVIITSNPNGMQRAVKHLELDGYEVKVLDSLSANLIDFFGAISNMSDDDIGLVNDTPDSEVEIDDTDEQSLDDAKDGESDVAMDVDASETTDSPDGGDNTVYRGMLNDEAIDVHEVPGDELILHPRTISGVGEQVKFTLSESIEMALWEENATDEDEMAEVSVHLVIQELEVDQQVKIKISTVTMDPPVILMGEEWFANLSSKSVDNKK